MSRNATKRKLACLAAVIAIGAALFGAPAALARGGGGGWHGGGMGGTGGMGGMRWHGGGGGWHGTGMAWRGAAWRGAAWRGAAWRGAAWRGAAWHGRFFPHRHFAFVHHRRFFGPFVGLYASGYGYGSCWSWVPTPAGWQYVWACGPYGYGYL